MGQSFQDSLTTRSSSQFSLLPLWPLLSLKPRLTLLFSMEPTDMASPTPVSTDTDTVATEPMEPTPIPMATTARGLLMLSLRPMPRLTPLSSTVPTDMASPTPVSTVVLSSPMAESRPPTLPMVPTPIAMATTVSALPMLDLSTLPVEAASTMSVSRSPAGNEKHYQK